MQLPHTLCAYQDVNYTIELKDEDQKSLSIFGPFEHVGPGIVAHKILDNISESANYSLRVRLTSVAGTSESDSYFLGKNARGLPKCKNITLSNGREKKS